MPRLVSVAVPVPALELLTYRVPEGLEVPAVGARVLVPLGARRVTGVVVRQEAAALAEGQAPALKDLIDVFDGTPFLPPGVVSLGLWVADYYACGPGAAIAAAMPPFAWVESEWRVRVTEAGTKRAEARQGSLRPALRDSVLSLLAGGRWTPLRSIAYQLEHMASGRRGRAVPARAAVRALQADGLVDVDDVLEGQAEAFKTIRVAGIAAKGTDALAGSNVLGPKQREALVLLAGVPEGMPVAKLRERGVSYDVLQRLAGRGLVEIRREATERDPFDTPALPAASDAKAAEGRVLTGEQAASYERLRRLAAERRFAAALLHGVTGSGKTEIYLRLAGDVCQAGRSVLVLAPEIGLTPALAGAFRQRFGDRVAIQHSGLSDGERHDQWQKIRRGAVSVVVGTRSAVFAPLESIGLVVVDEEHDGSYKQEETPRYHGRDVAVMRAKREDALVVLGSATPSLESYQNAANGRYELLTLDRRIFDRPLADVTVVDMRGEFAKRGPDVVLSQPLVEAIALRLARAEQVLLLLNRRGFATAVFCRQCAGTVECPNCSV